MLSLNEGGIRGDGDDVALACLVLSRAAGERQGAGGQTAPAAQMVECRAERVRGKGRGEPQLLTDSAEERGAVGMLGLGAVQGVDPRTRTRVDVEVFGTWGDIGAPCRVGGGAPRSDGRRGRATPAAGGSRAS